MDVMHHLLWLKTAAQNVRANKTIFQNRGIMPNQLIIT